MHPLQGVNVVSLAINAPGPVAAARLRDMGATVVKIEPPDGDPMHHLGVGWYESLTQGMDVRTLNLKESSAMEILHGLLAKADLLITAQRPASLERLGLGWEALHAAHPRLCHVGVVGFPPPHENLPGHDLTYQAKYGVINAPHMPRVLIADMAGAERAVSAALALLFARDRGQGARREWVALSEAAEAFAITARLEITTPGGLLGGGLPNYAIYPTQSGPLACAALEPHFFQKLQAALGCEATTHEALGEIFQTRTAEAWEAWALERDIPLAAIH